MKQKRKLKEIILQWGYIMTEKHYKEVIFQWINSGGEYQYERRIVRDEEKEVDLID
jgi:hypothetical protein